ncbi:hypothetical protein GN956_G11015 [Arapaima gigas]
MLTHPRKEFNIPAICCEVAPYLDDSSRKVRHAALELFSILDFSMEMDRKQLLIKAIDLVELYAGRDGLMAAIKARRAKRMLPRLNSNGIVEYALVLPVHKQQVSASFCSADVNWVLNGGHIKNYKTNEKKLSNSSQLCGTRSVDFLSEGLLHKRIISLRKKTLPFLMSDTVTPQVSINSKSRVQDSSEDKWPSTLEFSYMSAHSSISEQCQLQIKGGKELLEEFQESATVHSVSKVLESTSLSCGEQADHSFTALAI